MISKHKVLWSIILSIGMLLFSYWVTNLHFPISGEKEVISIFEFVRGIFMPEQKGDDDVLLIDVLYDKELIEKTDEMGAPLGDGYAITDRRKLLRLLEHLKRKNDYACILLDVTFDKDELTDVDNELFSTICSMNRIVMACDSVESLPNDCLREKAGLAHYYLTPIETDFVKYPYLYEEGRSMPLIMYEDQTKHKVCKHGIFYTDGWRLARKSIVLNIDYIPHDKDWLPLGDLLYNERIDSEPTKGKLIVIGSSKENDIHATYRGPIAGAIINLNAYKALMDGHHIVSLPFFLLLFISFFLFSYSILSQGTFCTWGNFSIYLTILCIITYCLLDEVYDIFITSSVFWLIKKMIKIKIKIRNEK